MCQNCMNDQQFGFSGGKKPARMGIDAPPPKGIGFLPPAKGKRDAGQKDQPTEYQGKRRKN